MSACLWRHALTINSFCTSFVQTRFCTISSARTCALSFLTFSATDSLRPLPKTKQSRSLRNAVGDSHAMQGDQPGSGKTIVVMPLPVVALTWRPVVTFPIMALPLFRSLRSQMTPETAVAVHRAVGLHKPPAHTAAVSALAAL